VRQVISLIILCLATVCSASTPPAVTLPDWVQQLASKPVGEYPPRTNAVVLLDETTVVFTTPTDYTETNRRVVRILRPEGRSENRFFKLFRPGDRVVNIHAWSVDAAGHKFELRDKDFAYISPYGDGLYSDDQIVGGEVSGSDVGSVVAFESVLQHHPIANQLIWRFQEEIPVKQARYTLELPAGWEYKASWANSVADIPRAAGSNRWEWSKSDVPGIVEESFAPAHSALAGRMAIALYVPSGTKLDSWQRIAQWNNGLTADRHNVSPEIADKVRQLTTGLTTFDTKVHAIADFLQRQVRYVAIEIGIGGYQPHYASDIFRKRYGDCKDKATLMAAMLQAAGINSHYVLVDTRHGVVHPDMPNIYAFNHEILAIELPSDAPAYTSVITAASGRKLLIFDPTDEYTPIGEVSSYRHDSLILLCDPAGGELIRLPAIEAKTNQRQRVGKFVLAADGALSGEVAETRKGINATQWRYALMDRNESERTRYVERYCERSVKGMSISEIKFENLGTLSQDLLSRFKVSAERYAQNSGTLLLVRPRVLGTMTVAIDWKDRKFPVHLGSPEHATDTYEIQLPEGYAVEDLPDPTRVDVGFASYTSKFEVAGSVVRYSREYTVRDPIIPLDKLVDLHKFEDRIGRDEAATIVLVKK
jgi:hypothetical protein